MSDLTAYERNVVLDALAVMAAAYLGQAENVALMHATYRDPADRAHLYGCILGASTALLRVLEGLGVSHESALGAARMHAMEPHA